MLFMRNSQVRKQKASVSRASNNKDTVLRSVEKQDSLSYVVKKQARGYGRGLALMLVCILSLTPVYSHIYSAAAKSLPPFDKGTGDLPPFDTGIESLPPFNTGTGGLPLFERVSENLPLFTAEGDGLSPHGTAEQKLPLFCTAARESFETSAETGEASEAAAGETAVASGGKTAAASGGKAAEAIAGKTDGVVSDETDGTSSGKTVSEERDILSVHLAGRPGDPVPSEVMDTDTASLLKLISEGLVVLDEKGEAAPGCARKWEVSEDGLQWTFTLRDDLRWSDGKKMKAKDFVRMFRQAADPSSETLYGEDLTRNIAGYEDILNGEDPKTLQVSAEDDHTLTVTLVSPDPGFARICAAWALLPIREQIAADSPETDWEKVTGNGAYRIVSGSRETEFLLQKNPYYNTDSSRTGAGEPLDEFRWIVAGDANREYSDFLNGGIDATASIPLEEMDDQGVSAEAADSFRQQTIPEITGIIFNCRQEALRDIRVRKALSLAVDREYAASVLLNDVYVPAAVSEKDTDAEEGRNAGKETGTETAAETAKELLKEAGFENGEGIPALTCLVDGDGGMSLLADYLAEAWKALGIEVKVEKTDAEKLARKKAKGRFDVICGSLLLPSDQPASELAGYMTESEDNVSGFSSEQFDASMLEAQDASDEDEYGDKLLSSAELLEEELPAVPLAVKNITWLQRKEAVSIFCDASGCWQLWKNASKEGPAPESPIKNQAGIVMRQESLQSGHPQPEILYTSRQSGRTQESGAVQSLSTQAASRQDSRLRTEAPEQGLLQPVTGPKGFLQQDLQQTASVKSGFLQTKSGGQMPQFDPKPRSFMEKSMQSPGYFQWTDQKAYLTRQAYVLDGYDDSTERIVSLPKYTEVRLNGIGGSGYVRITRNGKFCYLETDKVTEDEMVLESVRAREAEDSGRQNLLQQSHHQVKRYELKRRAEDLHKERDRIIAEIVLREQKRDRLRRQTRNPNWNGSVLSRSNGSVHGPSGKETYYNLNMSGVVSIMRRMGNMDEYWVRDDGCKMLGDYIMCAANLRVHPRGSLVESSLGTCIVCDTGGFASSNSHQLDIAVTW